MPTVANGIDLDWAFTRARGQNMEFELRKSFIRGRQGTTRILSYVNNAHMGIYKDAINAYLEGNTPTPEIAYNAPFGTMKYGFGWNNWQELTENLRIFSRVGWNEGAHDLFATRKTIRPSLSAETMPDRDGIILSTSSELPSSAMPSRNTTRFIWPTAAWVFCLETGGSTTGAKISSKATTRTTSIRAFSFLSGSATSTIPGYNRDRGPVWVPGVRAHVDF